MIVGYASSHSHIFYLYAMILGVALVNLGQTEAQIALLQEEFATTIKTDYIGVLEQGLQHYKDYYALKKKLESRRLDYDAKLSRLNKSKKEKPEWNQEMQAAKAKYEECEHLILEKMATLQDYEVRSKKNDPPCRTAN